MKMIQLPSVHTPENVEALHVAMTRSLSYEINMESKSAVANFRDVR
jgi:hypothetical protein